MTDKIGHYKLWIFISTGGKYLGTKFFWVILGENMGGESPSYLVRRVNPQSDPSNILNNLTADTIW